MSGKTMTFGDKGEEIDGKKKRNKKGDTTELPPPSGACQYAKMGEKYSVVAETIKHISGVCTQGIVTFDAGGQPFTLCPLHQAMVAGIPFYPDCDEAPLTELEINGKFAWATSKEKIDMTGNWSQDQERENWTGSWRCVVLTRSELDKLGGNIMVTNYRDDTFTVSVLVQGYSEKGDMAFIIVPKIQAQTKIPSTTLHEEWHSTNLTGTVRRQKGFRDGVGDKGNSLVEDLPVAGLSQSYDDRTNAKGQDEPSFEHTPSKHESAEKRPEGFVLDGVAAETCRAMWGKTSDVIRGGSTLSSPGRAPEVMRELRQGTLAKSVAGRDMDEQQQSKAFESPASTRRSQIEVQGARVRANERETNGRVATTAIGSLSISQSLTDLMDLIATGNFIGPSQQSRGVRRDEPDDDDPGDGEGGDDDEADEDPEEPVAGADELRLAGIVGAMTRAFLSSEDFLRAMQRRNAYQDKATERLLLRQGRMLAAATERLIAANERVALETIAAKRRLASEQIDLADSAEERKKDIERFQPGCKQVLALLRAAGDAANVHGFGHLGDPVRQVGSELNGSALYRAITDLVHSPDAATDLPCKWSPAMVWNLCGFRFGGAPDPEEPQAPIKYEGRSSIYDYLKNLHVNPNKTHKSYSNVVPKKDQAGFVSDTARRNQKFRNIYEVVDAWETLGKALHAVYGQRWLAVCRHCGNALRQLYEEDPEIFTLEVLKYLSDVGLSFWCTNIWLQSTDPLFELSVEEVALSRRFGFDQPITFPGMGFGKNSRFVADNVIDPLTRDIHKGMRHHVATLPFAARIAMNLSAVPYELPRPAVQPLGRGCDANLGESQERRNSDEAYTQHWEPVDDEEVSCETGLGGWDLQAFAFSDLSAANSRGEDLPLGGVGGCEEITIWAAGDTLGKGEPGGMRGPKGNGFKGGRGFKVTPSQPKLIKIGAADAKEAWRTLPRVVTPEGAIVGTVCFRWLCRNGCTSDRLHERHRPGERCHNLHSLDFEDTFVGFSWLHFVLSLLHGGFIERFMLHPPPSDPIALQVLADNAVKMHRNGDKVPATFLHKPNLRVGTGAPVIDIRSYFEPELGDDLGNTAEVSALQPGLPFSEGNYRGTKSGFIFIDGLAGLHLRDFGGFMPGRQGNDACLLITLGILLIPWGWNPQLYYDAARKELGKTDVAPDKVYDYQRYGQQLAEPGKINLHAVVHMGLPQHVAWLVAQRMRGEWFLALYTCGQPKQVVAAYIEAQHIVPATWGTERHRTVTWAAFEPLWLTWRAAHPRQVKVTHIGTLLAVLNDFKFGDQPCGILLGGNSSSDVAWDIMLGGRCFFSQCERRCVCPPDITASLPVLGDDPVVVDGCASNVPVAEGADITASSPVLDGLVDDPVANVSDGDVLEAVAEGALVAPRVPRVIVVDVSAARVSVGDAFAEWRRINMQKSERVKKGVPESFVSTDGRLAIVVLAKDGSTRECAIDVTNSSEVTETDSGTQAEAMEWNVSSSPDNATVSAAGNSGDGNLVVPVPVISLTSVSALSDVSREGAVTKAYVPETDDEEDVVGADEEDEVIVVRQGDGFGSGASSRVGGTTTRILSDVEQGLAGTQACNHKRKRDRQLVLEVEYMLRNGSPQVQALQPLVTMLKFAMAELKSAFLSTEPVGEAEKERLQKSYLWAANRLCHASVKLCNNRWWPQLFITAFRASHPGRVDSDVDPVAMEAVFKGLVSTEVLRTIVYQATTGEEIYLNKWPTGSWARESATAKEFKREIWSSIWKDAAFGSTFVFGSECLRHMALAEVQGYALHRVPKKNTATGLPTGAGRLIADLSHCNAEGYSINSMTEVDLYSKFKMARHADIAQSILVLRRWFPNKRIVIAKLDVARAFRRKMLAASAFGILGFKLSGHVCLEQSEVFGHNIAPAIYAFSSEAISQAHRASGIWLTVEELEDAGYKFVDEEPKSSKFVPFFSDTYCDDGILVAPEIERLLTATKESYIGFMKANLGPEAVSMKDLEEQEWRTEKVVIGQKFMLGMKPDARGDVDFLEPTAERILLMKRLMSSEQLTPEGKHTLTAGLCAKLFSLWLWMCIPCPRLKAFIGSFKRVTEGQEISSQEDIVTPVREGDDPNLAWEQFGGDMTTLKAVLALHESQLGFFRVPLFRLLSEEQQLSSYSERFDTISTDASFVGIGGYCHTGPQAGCYFRCPIPASIREDLKDCAKHGHDSSDNSKYTIAIAEKIAHTLGLMIFGCQGGCYIMLQDNQNVVDWVKKGWGKPMLAQALMRRDVMHGMHLDIWSIIQYIHTSQNVLADLLSRSFTSDGVDDINVLSEFFKAARMCHEQCAEVKISETLINKLFSLEPASSSIEDLMDEVKDARRFKLAETVRSAVQSMERESNKATDGGPCEKTLQKKWVSPLDEVSEFNEHWDEIGLGGYQTRTNATNFGGSLQSKPHGGKGKGSNTHSVFKDSVEFEIECLLNKRVNPKNGATEYKVKWKQFSHVYNTWKALEELDQAPEAVAAFEELSDERGLVPSSFTDREAFRFYYGDNTTQKTEVKGVYMSSVSKGPYEATKGGRSFCRLQEARQDSVSTEHQTEKRIANSWRSSSAELHDMSFVGPSLADKTQNAVERKGRRTEVIITKNDDRLVQAAARTLAHSLSKNTNRAYTSNFQLFLGFCARQNLSPVLNGLDKRKDEDTLIAFILYEYEIHGNKYSTLKLKLSAIRAAMMEEGYPNPIDGKYTLGRHMRGIKVLRGSTEAKEPLPAIAFRLILLYSKGKGLKARCIASGIVFAFFFLLRVSEFAARDAVYMEKFIALRQDVTFYKKGKLCAWNDPEADAVELFIKGSKTDQSGHGCRRMQHATGEEGFCPVRCIQDWLELTHGSAIPPTAPLFSVPIGRYGTEWEVITRDDVTAIMKGAAVECGVDTKVVGTHSIRISGATALLLAGIPPETVQIIGRWISNTFIGYQRYKAELMGGISKKMANTNYAAAQSHDSFSSKEAAV